MGSWSFLTTWCLGSRVSFPGEPGRSCISSCDLVLKSKHHMTSSSTEFPLAMWGSGLIQCRGELSGTMRGLPFLSYLQAKKLVLDASLLMPTEDMWLQVRHGGQFTTHNDSNSQRISFFFFTQCPVPTDQHKES